MEAGGVIVATQGCVSVNSLNLSTPFPPLYFLHTYLFMCVCACVYAYGCVYVHVYMHVCMQCVYAHVCMRVYACVCACVCACICTCVCVCVYVHVCLCKCQLCTCRSQKIITCGNLSFYHAGSGGKFKWAPFLTEPFCCPPPAFNDLSGHQGHYQLDFSCWVSMDKILGHGSTPLSRKSLALLNSVTYFPEE